MGDGNQVSSSPMDSADQAKANKLCDQRERRGRLPARGSKTMALTRRGVFLVVLFVICGTTQAVAQTIANPPPAPSAQGATPGNAPTSNLEQEINSEVAEAGNGKASLTEVNKELSNPISTIWAFSFQQNTFWLNKPERNVVNMLFQPVLPVSLTDNWNLITRPVIPVFNSTSLRQ